jgi:RNA polymerase sigma factor (sigma-70 family)
LQISEQEIVEGCKAGNRHMQQKLYSNYAAKMLALCHRYSHTTAEAEDILQEAFIKIFAKIDTYRFESPLGAWVRTIVVNTAINQIRKNKDLKFATEIDSALQVETGQINAISSLQHADLLHIIRSLPKGCQAVFNLYAIDGFEHKEIAQKLGISEGTSKSQYARAKVLLQKKLKDINANVI